MPRSLYGVFLDSLRPLAGAAPLVPLVLPKATEQARRLVAEALADGGRLLTEFSDEDANGAFPPAIVVDATPEMAICNEGSFAPLLAVLPYDALEDAVRMNAQCSFRLGASIFTRNPERALKLAPLLGTGSVSINVIPRSSAAQIVRIERSSSVPPHIQPPIAHVPSPIREGARLVPSMFL